MNGYFCWGEEGIELFLLDAYNGPHMIDHISLSVKNLNEAKTFYVQALAPLGYEVSMQGEGYCGIGKLEGDDAWIGTIWLGEVATIMPTHVAFRVENRATVDAFYKAALAAGGTDNGAPGIRSHYHKNYYGAFVLDASGHNIEAVCHKAE